MHLSVSLKDSDYRLSQFSEEIIIKSKQQSEHLLEITKRAARWRKTREELRMKKTPQRLGHPTQYATKVGTSDPIRHEVARYFSPMRSVGLGWSEMEITTAG